MSKISTFAIIVSTSAFVAACGGTSTTDNRPNSNAVANRASNTTTSPGVPPTATPAVNVAPTATPARTQVPAANTNSSPAAERPRIVEEKKSARATAPSTEIPSDDEMRKAFARPVTKDEVNDSSMMRSTPMMKSKPGETMRPKSDNTQMTKSTRKLGGKPL